MDIEKKVAEAIASELLDIKDLTFIISMDQLTNIVSNVLLIGLRHTEGELLLQEHEDIQKTVNDIVELADGWSDKKCSKCEHQLVKSKIGNPFCVNFDCPNRYAVIVPTEVQTKE